MTLKARAMVPISSRDFTGRRRSSRPLLASLMASDRACTGRITMPREQQVQQEQQQHEGRADEAVEEAPGEGLRAAQLGQRIEEVQAAEGLVARAQLRVVMEDALPLPHRLAEAARGGRGQLVERLAAGGVDRLPGDDGLPARAQHGRRRPAAAAGRGARRGSRGPPGRAGGPSGPDRRWRRGVMSRSCSRTQTIPGCAARSARSTASDSAFSLSTS